MSCPIPTIDLDAATVNATGKAVLRQAQQLQQLLQRLQAADSYDPATPHEIRKLTRKCAAGWQLLHRAHAVKRGRRVLRYWQAVRHHLGKLRDADIRLELFHASFPRSKAQQQLLGHLEHSWLLQYQQTRKLFDDDVTNGKTLIVKLRKVLAPSRNFRWNRRSQRWLQRMLTRWAEQAGTSLTHPECLHPFRISTKKLRYRLQYLEHILPQDAAWLSTLEPLQEQLGRYHDALNTLAWILELEQLHQQRPATNRVLRSDLRQWRSSCIRLQRTAYARIRQLLRQIVKVNTG